MTMNEVWQWAAPYIVAGRLTRKDVVAALRYKGGGFYTQRVITALRGLLESQTRQLPWQQERAALGLSAAAYWLYCDIRTRECRPGVLHKAHGRIFVQALNELEQKSLVVVRRSRSGAVINIQMTQVANP
jgi:hypothetical protein